MVGYTSPADATATLTAAWKPTSPEQQKAIATAAALVPTTNTAPQVGSNTSTKPSQTTLYSGNVNEKVIPDQNARLDSLSQKGQYTDGQGTLRFSDGSLVPAPVDAKLSANGNYYDTAGAAYGKSSTGGVAGEEGSNDLGIPPAEQALIDQMKASTDAATKATIDAIESTYNAIKQEQRGINAGQQAATDTALMRAGSSRYSPESAASQSATQASYGLKQIADLEAKEQSAIAAAKAAQQSKNYELMGKQLEIAETVRKEKHAAAQKVSEKLLADKEQAKKDNAITQLYSEGTTDPVSILTKLGDLGITNVTASDVAGTLKNILPAGLDDLVKTMRLNGATGELISKVLQSPDMNAAYKAAGNFASGGAGIIGEYNYAKANGYTGTFSQYQNEDANRKAKAAGTSMADMFGTPATDTTGTNAVGQGKSGDILTATGLSLPAFNFLTQGTAALTRMDSSTRLQIMKEASDWAKKNGVDVSTFQSQYKAYNDVLTKNISRANQTQIMAGEVSGSADSLMAAIDEKDLPKFTRVKPILSVGQNLSLAFNGPVATKYATQLQFMANDLAGYFAASRGATAPELQDMEDAAKIVNDGMSKGSVQAFKDSLNANEEKVAGVVQHAVDSTRKQVWGLFGAGDKYTSSPVQKTSDQIATDDKAAVGKIVDFQNTSTANKAIIDNLHTIMPDATASEIAQYLGI